MFSTTMRVYYEDTDAAGVVYYANYLKYAERARTEWLRSLGFNQAELMQREGLGFVVANVAVRYISPARLDDVLTVECTITILGRARIAMQQIIRNESQAIATVDVAIACVDRNFSPTRLPDTMYAAFAKYTH